MKEKFTTEENCTSEEEVNPIIVAHVNELRMRGYRQERLEDMRDYLKLANTFIDKALDAYNETYVPEAKSILKDVVNQLSRFNEQCYDIFKKHHFKKLVRLDFNKACNVLKDSNKANIDAMTSAIEEFKQVQALEDYNDMQNIFPNLKDDLAPSVKKVEEPIHNGRPDEEQGL